MGVVDRDSETAEFFDGTAAGRFLLRYCPTCDAYAEPQATACPEGCGTEPAWRQAAGGAGLVSWAVSHAKDGGTTILVIAEFDEGPWWWSRLVDADPATLTVGTRLVVAIEPGGQLEAVPVFRLAGSV